MGNEGHTQGISRRNFITSAAMAGAAVTLASLTGCASGEEAKGAEATGEQGASQQNWDASYDVVVVGCGFAGMATAITAKNAGAEVVIVEKAPEAYAGGNSRVCGQLLWSPTTPEGAKSYFLELNAGHDEIPEDLLNAYAEELPKNKDWILQEIGVDMNQPQKGAEYPNAPSADKVSDKFFPEGGISNGSLWYPMLEHVIDLGIDVLYDHDVQKLVMDNGTVVGIEATTPEGTKTIGGTKGVALCCGGFENNQDMKSNYLTHPVASRPLGTPYNTGQGIKMCQAIGADFWHMNTWMGMISFDCKAASADLDDDFKDNAVSINPSVADGAIWLDKYGKRFMDESRDAQHGLGFFEILHDDSNNMEWPRIPMWIIADDRQVQDIGFLMKRSSWCTFFEALAPKTGCEEEIEKGWILKADSIEELAELTKLDPEALKATMEQYNSYAAAGVDESYGRKPETMFELVPPFYACEAWPAMLNTDGGPKHDAKGRVLDTFGEPIPHLYAVGELGSIWSHWYQGGGNVGECLGFGRIVGTDIVSGS